MMSSSFRLQSLLAWLLLYCCTQGLWLVCLTIRGIGSGGKPGTAWWRRISSTVLARLLWHNTKSKRQVTWRLTALPAVEPMQIWSFCMIYMLNRYCIGNLVNIQIHAVWCTGEQIVVLTLCCHDLRTLHQMQACSIPWVWNHQISLIVLTGPALMGLCMHLAVAQDSCSGLCPGLLSLLFIALCAVPDLCLDWSGLVHATEASHWEGSSCQDCCVVEAALWNQGSKADPEAQPPAAAPLFPGQAQSRRGAPGCCYQDPVLPAGHSEGPPLCQSCADLPVQGGCCPSSLSWCLSVGYHDPARCIPEPGA